MYVYIKKAGVDDWLKISIALIKRIYHLTYPLSSIYQTYQQVTFIVNRTTALQPQNNYNTVTHCTHKSSNQS